MLILLHGALGDQSQFTTLRKQLGTRESSSLDFAGHGRQPAHGRPIRMETFVDDVVAHLDEIGVQRADLFGYSMGGYVALLMATRHPERVSRVVTLATKLHWTPESAARESLQLDPQTIRQKVPRFAAQLEVRHAASGWEQLLTETASMMHALGEASLLTEQEYRTIQCPVRLCVGDRDTTAGVEETRAVQRLIPNAELEVLPRTPHPFERVSLSRLVFSLEEFLSAAR